MSVHHHDNGDHQAHDSHDASHVADSVGKYKMLFYGLLFLTFVTVGVSYIDLGHVGNMLLGLAIASLKAGLVAAIFMHLWGEKFTIWRFLIFTTIFVTGLFALSLLAHSDPVPWTATASHGKSWRTSKSMSLEVENSEAEKAKHH